MANFKELTSRIKSIKNAQQITNTMQMVSAARLRKTETQLRNAREYGNKIDQLTRKLSKLSSDFNNPLFEKRTIKNITLAVVTSDRGLCGSYNTNVMRMAEKLLDGYKKSSGNVKLVIIGKKGFDFFKSKKIEIDKTYAGLVGKINIPIINEITAYLTESFLNHDTDEVYLLYTAYKSAMKYIPTVVKFLNIESIPTESSGSGSGKDVENEYIIEPDLQGVLDKLLPLYIKNKMLLSISESITSENSSRMIAMKSATDNAEDLVKEITKQRNKARQTAITTEILEIIAGAEAIKKN